MPDYTEPSIVVLRRIDNRTANSVTALMPLIVIQID